MCKGALFLRLTCFFPWVRPPQPKEVGLPFTAYLSVEEVRTDGTEKAKKVSARGTRMKRKV